MGGQGESQRLPDTANYETRLYPCKEGDVTSSGEQDSLKDSLGEYDTRLYPCKEGDVTSSGKQDSIKDSLSEYDTRPHPCKQGDVFEVQGGSGAYRTPRVRGVTPVKPIVIRTRIFVSSTRKKKPENLRKSSIEEKKYAKIREKAEYFPCRGWSVTKKELLVTSGKDD